MTRQNKQDNKFFIGASKKIVLVAIMSTLLVVGKFALSALANIEVVTTLVIVFSFVFGFDALFATIIFCVLDIFLYPPSPDVIVSYFIYWDLLSIAGASLRKMGIKSEYIYLALGLVMTALFGVITTLMYSLFYAVPFWPAYISGLLFYALHIMSTLVFMLIGFRPLTKLLFRINFSK